LLTILNNIVFVLIIATTINIIFVNILLLFKLNIAQEFIVFIAN